MKYTDIKNLAELDSAIKAAKGKSSAKAAKVGELWAEAREAYSGTNLIASGLRGASGLIPFDRIALWGLRALRRKLRG